MEDTKIIKLPFSAFKIAFEKYPDAYLRVVQIVMIRLQRVTLLALHQYLGLGTELIANQHRGNKNLKYRLDRMDSVQGPGGGGGGGAADESVNQPSILQMQMSSKFSFLGGFYVLKILNHCTLVRHTLKETVRVISSDLPCKDSNSRFTTVPLKPQ